VPTVRLSGSMWTVQLLVVGHTELIYIQGPAEKPDDF